MARVFVDLPAFAEPSADPPAEDAPALLPPGIVTDVITRDDIPRDANGKLDDVPAPLVIVGGPGQGKSTLVQFLCQLYRSALLLTLDSNVMDSEARDVLAAVVSQAEARGIPLPIGRRLPIRIVLNRYAQEQAEAAPDGVLPLIDYLARLISRRVGETVSLKACRQLLSAYPWVVVLDGLDEVPTSTNREAVVSAVADFWIDAAASGADVLFIATTRPQGYNDEFPRSRYQHLWLAPLSRRRALHYGELLADQRYHNDPERRALVRSRLREATTVEATARMMQTPLQVTILTALVARMGRPPQQRWTLFSSYYQVVYERERDRDSGAARVLRDYRPDIEAVHRRVALVLQIGSEQSGGTDTRLTVADFTEIVRHRLEEEDHPEAVVRELLPEIIQAASERLVFLVGLEHDAVGFELRSLQEFIAGEALLDSADPAIVEERLKRIAGSSHWRNCFLFAAGHCFFERQYLRSAVATICAEVDESDDSPPGSAILLGARLACDLIEDGSTARQPKYEQLLARQALRLVSIADVDAHDRLARIYDDRLEATFVDALTGNLSVAQIRRDIGRWRCLFRLVDRGVAWAEAFVRTAFWAERIDVDGVAVLAGSLPASSALAGNFAKLFPDISPRSLLAVGAEGRPSSPEGDLGVSVASSLSGGPKWIEAARVALFGRTSRSRDVPVFEIPFLGCRVALPGGHCARHVQEGVRRSFWPGSAREAPWALELAPLLTMSSPAPEWRPYIAAAQLYSSLSGGMLASRLQAHVAHGMGEQDVNDLVLGRFPWPLSACLLSEMDGVDLARVYPRAHSGFLGSGEEWIEAEERWCDQGVRFDDVVWIGDEHFPFDDDVLVRGFPLALLSLGEPVDLRPEWPFQVLQLASRLLEEGRGRSAACVARLAGAGFHRLSGKGVSARRLSGEELRALLWPRVRYPSGPFHMASLALFGDELMEEAQAQTALELISARARLVPGSVSNGSVVSQWLLPMIRASDDPRRLLRLVSFMDGLQDQTALREQARGFHNNSDRATAAFALVAEIACTPPGNEREVIRRSDWAFVDVLPADSTARLVVLLTRRNCDFDVVGPLLLELTKRWPEWYELSRSTIQQALQRSDRAPSGLEQAEVWDGLLLPVGLRRFARKA